MVNSIMVGVDMSLALKTSLPRLLFLSWRRQQVEGKRVAAIQPDAAFPAGAWLVAVAVLPRSCWYG